MTSPFSKDYKPQIDTASMVRETKISQIRTESRQRGLESSDPDVRRRATGTLGGLSANGVGHTFMKDKGGKKCKG